MIAHVAFGVGTKSNGLDMIHKLFTGGFKDVTVHTRFNG